MDPRDFTLKRAAWAFGCARKGSHEEAQLLEVLLTKLEEATALRERIKTAMQKSKPRHLRRMRPPSPVQALPR